MATGDMKNNLKKLQSAVKVIKYEKDVDVDSLSKGIPGCFLPIYHYAFIEYSRPIAEEINKLDIELFGKADLRFIECMYKILRELFSYKPVLTKDQFFSNGFAEKKVIMCTEIVSQVRALHKKLSPKPRPKSARSTMTAASVYNATPVTVNHKAAAAAMPPPHSQNRSNSNNILSAKSKLVSSNNQQSVLPEATTVNTTNVIPNMHHIVEASIVPRPLAPHGLPTVQCHTNKRPATAMHVYNPSSYVTRSDGDTEGITRVNREALNVEVVSLNSDSSDDNCYHNMRPIDMIAKTPGRPLVQSHVHRVQASGDSAELLTQHLLTTVEQKLGGVAQTVSALVERVAAVEMKLTQIQDFAPQETSSSVEKETVENIQARLTLLENNFKLIKSQVNPLEIHRDEASFPDSLEKPSTAHESIHVVIEPKPARHVIRSFTDEQNAMSSPSMTSTPVDAVTSQLCYAPDACNTQSPPQQAPQSHRIQAMLRETESLLKISVASPVHADIAAANVQPLVSAAAASVQQ